MSKKSKKKAKLKAKAKASLKNKKTSRKSGASPAKAKKGKYVYYFGDGRADGNGSMKALLGGKGANLAEMTRIGLAVPPGFTISTEVCTYYYDHNKSYPRELQAQIDDAVGRLEKSHGKTFGSSTNPLLVAVR